MCGRYTVYSEHDIIEMREIIEELNRKFGYEPSSTGEIRPTDLAPVLQLQGDVVTSAAIRWGFPHFSGSGVVINARAETALDKPMFRRSLLDRRCVMPATGFFEWMDLGGRMKAKHLLNLPESQILYLAGMTNHFDKTEGPHDAFVILTTAANESVAPIHNRMPVILTADEIKPWLTDPGAMSHILTRPGPRLLVWPA